MTDFNKMRIQNAQADSAEAPLGRYQGIGKREYKNGTEVYSIDTKTGRLCYGFVANDGTPSTNACTDPAI